MFPGDLIAVRDTTRTFVLWSDLFDNAEIERVKLDSLGGKARSVDQCDLMLVLSVIESDNMYGGGEKLLVVAGLTVGWTWSTFVSVV